MSKCDYAKVQSMVKALEPQIAEMCAQLKEWEHGAPPLSAQLRAEIIAYYANGREYETSHNMTPIADVPNLLRQAKYYHWSVSFDENTQTMRLEKHFPSGMYRIATYTPYGENLKWFSKEEDGDEIIVHINFEEK